MPKLSGGESPIEITRRKFVMLSAAGATALPFALSHAAMAVEPNAAGESLYADLLGAWCDGLIAHQIAGMNDPALDGAFVCPACSLIHGRCGDAVHPLLRMAHSTGDGKYVRAAIAAHDWAERNVSRSDGSWINDVLLSSWKGITVFHAIALAEALEHHGGLLDAKTRQSWTDRLAKAAKFLDGFIAIETGNINYPVTASCCFALCARVLGEHHYADRARELAHTALDYFTPRGLLYGEGHPQRSVSPKGCYRVDLGYNVEESLPALALYSVLAGDEPVKDKVAAALRAHMEFMLPDGAWDNSWGTRNYKWSWWGSRTTDGCQPAYMLLADRDPRFIEVARRSTELMAACTHNGLLYGGPDYFAHGDAACVHHTFTHAKALATVLDRGGAAVHDTERKTLPRDEAYALKSFPEIGTHLASVGPWRATVTEYDQEYVEHGQAGSADGHVTGGALSLLFHRELGPLLVASMAKYQIVENSNQQVFREGPHSPLTPRIEYNAPESYTSISDLAATLKFAETAEGAWFEAAGRMLASSHDAPRGSQARYALTYSLSASHVEIAARIDADTPLPAAASFVLPVIARAGEAVTLGDAHTVRIQKPKGVLAVRTDAAFALLPQERTFNLVPGFECALLTVPLKPGETVRVTLEKI